MSKRSRAAKAARAGGSNRAPKAAPAAGATTRPGTAVPPRPAGQRPTRTGPKRLTREERQAETRRARRRSILVRIGIVAATLVGAAAFVWFGLGLGDPQLGISQPFEGGIGLHVSEGETLPQRNRPPSSGPHYASRAAYGVSPTPIPAGNWIHVLEHGGIVVLYKCATPDECSQQADRIRTTVYDPARPGKHGERKLTAVPYQDMDSPITVVAWGRILPLNEVDATQILAFYDRYLDRGPEDAP